MASPASPEASEIRRRGRRRLIGAVAIAVLLVVFVPMILDSEPRAPRNTPALEIPPKDKAPALPAPAPPKPAATLPSVLPAEPQPAPSVPAKQAVPAPAAPVAQATPALE
ncbi:MAG TPA: hypothetical protein VF348_04960, partial [Usitatibacter sp.]